MSTSESIVFVNVGRKEKCIGVIHARGRGGGGYRGGGGRYSGGRSSARSSYRSAFSGHRISSSSSSVRTALLAGSIYGATRWRTRRPSYYHDDDALPTICYNDKFNQSENGNVSYYGRFVCPEYYQGYEYNYCCGEEGIQYCCTFWDDGGRVAGVVLGILVAIGGIVVCIFCLVKFLKARKAQSARSRPIHNANLNAAYDTKQHMETNGYSNNSFGNNAYGVTHTYNGVTAQPPPYSANGIISIEGRGGRGGGRFGGRSYRGSRSSYRSSRSSYRSKFSSYHTKLSTTNIRTAILAGTIFGATRWRYRRPNYYHNDHDLPKICYNDKYVTNSYGNVSYYGRFICPQYHQGNDHNYCCGDEGLQYCCTFWDE
ncbi:hypothetical protein FSP39_012088 [Pinctada imbricata]|uniref:Uncharacterized protein n=1 Tax=Pinctada imbricata TaxID=66713 RepID=A0AA88XU87_PINIB|nr:hypothetical protein FSP39_012088 [Pinctada imbricata]